MNRSVNAILLLCLTCFSFTSLAHTRSQSFSQWQISDQKVTLSFNILSREITRLAADASVDVRKELSQLLIDHLEGKIQANMNGIACQIIKPLIKISASKGYTRLEAEFSCLPGSEFQLVMQGFFDVVPSHLHYARVISSSGEAREMVLSDATRTQVINLNNSEKSYWETAKTYLKLGLEHILIGNDHLIFLLALVLLCGRLSQGLILVTGFTLGHSITLSLSVFGWLQPNMTIVEALIGFSIVLVALEKIQRTTDKKLMIPLAFTLFALVFVKSIFSLGLPVLTLFGITLFSMSYLVLVKDFAVKTSPEKMENVGIQFLLTGTFGFIHGFGFADVLREIGLPPDQLGFALFSFNLGVELGQILVLSLMTVVFILSQKLLSINVRAFATTSLVSIVLGLGSYWFFVRSLNY
ncbi:MAG: HupE/UreJ family protein [Paraglaciecola sp.]|uniref:HupE/UreJ family protein n=1 Tax=Paraglaciecola sp. TaxID=1920173 RepID=UPI0032994E35